MSSKQVEDISSEPKSYSPSNSSVYRSIIVNSSSSSRDIEVTVVVIVEVEVVGYIVVEASGPYRHVSSCPRSSTAVERPAATDY